MSSLIDKPRQPRVLKRHPQKTLDAPELARRESAVNNEGGMISYRITSPWHLWSLMPVGGPIKSSSSQTTRGRSTSTLLLTAKDPYRVVSQCAILNRETFANFAIRVHSRDSLEERSEWTKPGRRLFGIIRNDKNLGHCIPVVSF